MEVSDSEVRSEMRCAIKLFYRLGKTADLMKNVYKNKCLGESMTYRSHHDFKK